jgi:hypothetical protein
MATPIAPVRYTSKDFATLRDETLARVPVLTGGKWTDLNESDIGVAIIELLIGMLDQQNFYLDQQANEGFLPTSRQRQNVQNLLTLVGYDMKGSQSAQGQVTVSILPTAIPFTYPIFIPRGTQFLGRSEALDTIYFYSLTDAQINTPNSDTGVQAVVTLPVIQGKPAGSAEVFASDGTANQRYVLRTQSVDRALLRVYMGTTEITALAATPWLMVTTLLDSQSADHNFLTSQDERDNVFIQFGDGKFGAIPQVGQNIYVYPVVTAGGGGNIAAGTITKVNSPVNDHSGNPIALTVTNVKAITGGADPESIESAKRNGPALFSALYRAMTKNDYIVLMQTIAGVDKANAWGEQEEAHPNYKLQNRVTLTFLALDTNGVPLLPTSTGYQNLQASILALMEERKPVTTRIVFKQPEWVDLLINVSIAVDRTKYDSIIVAGDVKLALQDYFSYANVSFGRDARQSEVTQVVQAVTGVSWATVQLGTAASVFNPNGGFDPNNPSSWFDPNNPAGWVTSNGALTPGFQDIPVSRWQLIRINDYDPTSTSTTIKDAQGNAVTHIIVSTRNDIDAPVPDQMADPCRL